MTPKFKDKIFFMAMKPVCAVQRKKMRVKKSSKYSPIMFTAIFRRNIYMDERRKYSNFKFYSSKNVSLFRFYLSKIFTFSFHFLLGKSGKIFAKKKSHSQKKRISTTDKLY